MKSQSKIDKYVRKQVNILGVRVDSTSKEELLTQIREKLYSTKPFYIVTPNPEIILQAQHNPELTEILNNADFAVPDGVGLKIANKNLEVIKGRELMINLFKLANEEKLKVYLLGARPEVNKKALNIIRSQYVNVKVKGTGNLKINDFGHPTTENDINLQSEVVKEINTFKPDLLFVAFGAPKQELWIYKNVKSKMLNVKCVMAVGGSLDYFAGFVKPVPVLFEGLNLEWLWRLLHEPKRIKRIFNALVVFPIKVTLVGGQSKKQD